MRSNIFYFVDNILYFIAFFICANGNYMNKTTLAVSIPKGLRHCLLIFFATPKVSIFIIINQIVTIFNLILAFLNVMTPINKFISLDDEGHIAWMVGLQVLLFMFAAIDILLTYLYHKIRRR